MKKTFGMILHPGAVSRPTDTHKHEQDAKFVGVTFLDGKSVGITVCDCTLPRKQTIHGMGLRQCSQHPPVGNRAGDSPQSAAPAASA